jgi:hypothetical protein
MASGAAPSKCLGAGPSIALHPEFEPRLVVQKELQSLITALINRDGTGDVNGRKLEL